MGRGQRRRCRGLCGFKGLEVGDAEMQKCRGAEGCRDADIVRDADIRDAEVQREVQRSRCKVQRWFRCRDAGAEGLHRCRRRGAEVAAEVQWCRGVELQSCRGGVVEVQWCRCKAADKVQRFRGGAILLWVQRCRGWCRRCRGHADAEVQTR